MPKNRLVFNEVPKNNLVFDEVPKNRLVFDEKPNTSNMKGEMTRSYNVTIGVGQYMGLPFLLTYPSAIDTIQWSESGMVTP